MVEGAGAASVAALLAEGVGGTAPSAAPLGREHRRELLIEVLRHGLTRAGRYLVVRTRVTTGRAS